MHIISSEKKETIRVLHNNLEDMGKNLLDLKADGWSPNTRVGAMEDPMIREIIQEGEIEGLQRDYPEVEIQRFKKGGILGDIPFVYLTEHNRNIKASVEKSAVKTILEIEEEIEATRRTLENYRNAYKKGKIPRDVLDNKFTDCTATIQALKWVLGENDRFD